MNTTVLVIPCFNEAARLNGDAFTAFLQRHPHIHCLFVNDGSTDTTAGILDSLAQKSTNISVLHLKTNSGKAEAVRQGFIKAFAMKASAVGFIDADLAAPLECVPELEHYLIEPRTEIVIGARVALLGRRIQRDETRHFCGRVFATLASRVLHLRIYDTQCGAKLFRVTDRLKKVFAAPFSVKWIFDVEILARFMITEKDGYTLVRDICVEHPLQTWTDIKGSKLRSRDFFISTLDLWKIYVLIQKNTLPPY